MANTERFADVLVGLNDTAENLSLAIEQDASEISPSTLFAVASILEGVIWFIYNGMKSKTTDFLSFPQSAFINGSPQNTFVPGCLELAEKSNLFIGGDDLKSGQTKLKSVLVDFLFSAGLKPVSIVSYNHLGNNDGKNISAPPQFRSKEVRLLPIISHRSYKYFDANELIFQKNISNHFLLVADFQEQRCWRYGRIESGSLQTWRKTRPLRRNQIRPLCW